MSHIGYVTTTFPTLARFVEAEVAGLVRAGHRVTVFTLRPVGREYQPDHAALLPLVRFVGAPWSRAAMAAGAREAVRRPAALGGDVARVWAASLGDGYALAGHVAYVPAACRVAQAARREGIERLHGAWAHFPATVAWLAARWSGARFSFSAHAGADLYRSTAFLGAKLRDADFVATCVRGNRAALLAAAPDAGDRVHCIYHGIDLARFDGEGRQPEASPSFLAVGALRPAKGFDTAILAVARLASQGLGVRLRLVGDGSERAPLQRLAAGHGVQDRVEFLGSLTHDHLLPLYRRAWALVAPSVVLSSGRRDGIPNVVLEGMAMGLPCVATRAAGIEEAVEEGATGYLAPPGDAEALAAAMRRVVEDRERAERMGRAARTRARADFDAARNFEVLRELFERPWGSADGVADRWFARRTG